MFLSNAFSLQMLGSGDHILEVTQLSLEEVKDMAGSLISTIGHADIAAVLTNMLGVPVEMNRTNTKLSDGESIIVAQFMGGRLPEGSTSLPPGFELEFFQVQVTAKPQA